MGLGSGVAAAAAQVATVWPGSDPWPRTPYATEQAKKKKKKKKTRARYKIIYVIGYLFHNKLFVCCRGEGHTHTHTHTNAPMYVFAYLCTMKHRNDITFSEYVSLIIFTWEMFYIFKK